MIEYFTIVIIAIVQIGSYLWMDKRSYQTSKIWVLLGFLIAQLLILPQVALSLYGLNNRECGMPLLGLQLFFLLLGGGLNLIAHCIYYLIKRKTKNINYEL